MVNTAYKQAISQLISSRVSLFCFLFFFLSLFSSFASAVNITVKTSHNPVALDDSFHLIYEADSSVDDDPDFTPLEKNFEILNSSQSTNMRLINGNYSLKKSWNLALIAKDVGQFTIPSIPFGSDKSPSIRITIKNSITPNSTLPNGQASIPAKIFLESSIDKKSSFVQEQLLLTIRLLRTVAITGASLSEPTTSDSDAIIQRIGDDSNYQTNRNGLRYDVIERRYVIYPQHSGKLTVNPITFEGRINATQPRSIFDQFRMSGQVKRLRSSAINTRIKPHSNKIRAQDWLPASQLVILDEWSEDLQSLKTGEPVTRTISIIAKGLTGTQLPDLGFDEITNLKQYPNKPITTDKTEHDGITGAKQIKIALIPAKPGEYILPEVSVVWWNTKTNKLETATIAETMITAIGQVAETAVSLPTVIDQNSDLTNTLSPDQDNAQLPTISAPSLSEQNHFWRNTSIALGISWLLTLIYLFKNRKNHASQKTASAPTRSNLSSTKLEKNVLKACKTNSPEEIKQALLDWSAGHWPESSVNSLSQLALRCSDILASEISTLNTVLYDPDYKQSLSYDASALSAAFTRLNSSTKKTASNNENTLESLYKS